LFYYCAAKALLADQASVVSDALAAAQDFALTGRRRDDTSQLLGSLDEWQARLDEADVVIHDGLICADIALRIASTEFEFDAADGVWYVLEPQFQATSQRLFGFTDVGSEREEHDEAVALTDRGLAHVLDVVSAALVRLQAKPTEQETEATSVALRAVRP
jgi:hypothetical protein